MCTGTYVRTYVRTSIMDTLLIWTFGLACMYVCMCVQYFSRCRHCGAHLCTHTHAHTCTHMHTEHIHTEHMRVHTHTCTQNTCVCTHTMHTCTQNTCVCTHTNTLNQHTHAHPCTLFAICVLVLLKFSIS